jgi:hypothetical protein
MMKGCVDQIHEDLSLPCLSPFNIIPTTTSSSSSSSSIGVMKAVGEVFSVPKGKV